MHRYTNIEICSSINVSMDVGLSGGFAQNRKGAAMVEAENKICTPHTWIHGMGLAAALHMAGAVNNCPSN